MSYKGERERGEKRQKGAGHNMGTKSDYERERETESKHLERKTKAE